MTTSTYTTFEHAVIGMTDPNLYRDHYFLWQ